MRFLGGCLNAKIKLNLGNRKDEYDARINETFKYDDKSRCTILAILLGFAAVIMIIGFALFLLQHGSHITVKSGQKYGFYLS